MSDQRLSPEQRAGDIVDAWEHFEGETMRDGHRATMERLIASQVREAVEATARQERERLAQEIEDEALKIPLGTAFGRGSLAGSSKYNVAMWAVSRIRRSRPEEPKPE